MRIIPWCPFLILHSFFFVLITLEVFTAFFLAVKLEWASFTEAEDLSADIERCGILSIFLLQYFLLAMLLESFMQLSIEVVCLCRKHGFGECCWAALFRVVSLYGQRWEGDRRGGDGTWRDTHGGRYGACSLGQVGREGWRVVLEGHLGRLFTRLACRLGWERGLRLAAPGHLMGSQVLGSSELQVASEIWKKIPVKSLI